MSIKIAGRPIQIADLDTLLAEGLPVYVVNTSGTENDSIVIFTNKNGEPLNPPHIVPYQAVPWNLSGRLGKESIASSTDLRQWIADGNLTVLDPDFAAEVLENPRVERMLRKLDAHRKPKRARREAARKKQTAVSPRVLDIMARLQVSNGDHNAQQAAIDALDLASDGFGQPEFVYVIQHSQEHDEVRTWAMERVRDQGDDDGVSKKLYTPRRTRKRGTGMSTKEALDAIAQEEGVEVAAPLGESRPSRRRQSERPATRPTKPRKARSSRKKTRSAPASSPRRDEVTISRKKMAKIRDILGLDA